MDATVGAGTAAAINNSILVSEKIIIINNIRVSEVVSWAR
jgi:hypothetical protein